MLDNTRQFARSDFNLFQRLFSDKRRYYPPLQQKIICHIYTPIFFTVHIRTNPPSDAGVCFVVIDSEYVQMIV